MRLMLSLAALLVLLANMVAAGAVEYPLRTWTNDQGQTIDASLTRLSGGTAILDQDGKVVRAPINRLSEEDRAWIKSVRELNRWREWTMADGTTRRAKLETFDDGTFTLKDTTSTFDLSLDEFSDADREQLAEVFGVAPPAEASASPVAAPVISDAITPTNPPARRPRGPLKLANQPARTWTDVDGKSIEAQLRGWENDNLVLYFKDREWRVPLEQFSQSDQQYFAQVLLEVQGLDKQVVANTDPPVHDIAPPARDSFQGGMHAIRGRMTPGLNVTLGDDTARENEDARTRMQGRMEQAKRDADERMAKLERERQERETEFQRRHEQSMGEPHPVAADSGINQAAESSSPGFEPAAPTYPTSTPDPAGVMVHVYECYSCDKTWESAREYKAGDKCPHCGVVFDAMEDENGKIVDETSTYRARRYGGIIKLVLFAVIAVGGFLSRMGRS